MFLLQLLLCVPWVVPEGNNKGLSPSHLSSYAASLPLVYIRFHRDQAILGLSLEQPLKEKTLCILVSPSLSFKGLSKHELRGPILESHMASLRLQSQVFKFAPSINHKLSVIGDVPSVGGNYCKCCKKIVNEPCKEIKNESRHHIRKPFPRALSRSPCDAPPFCLCYEAAPSPRDGRASVMRAVF